MKFNLNLKYNKVVIIFIAVIINFSIIFLIILPTIKKIKQLTNDTYSQRVALEKLYLRGQSIKKSKQNYEKIKDKVENLETVFNKVGKELDFIKSLEQIAQKQNIQQIIEIKNNKTETEKFENENYKEIQVSVNLNGDFNNIINYLEQAQLLDYYFNINYLDFYYSKAKSFKQIKESIDENELYEKSNTFPKINAVFSGLTYWK